MKLAKGEYRADRGSRSRSYGTPKEVWGFRRKVAQGDPADVALRFLDANADLLGIGGVLPRLHERAVLHGLGATHVILQQSHHRIRIHRGFVTVHIAKNGEVYLVKSRATPPKHLPKEPKYELTRAQARRYALEYLEKEADPAEVSRASDPVKRWFYDQGRLRPTWRVRVSRRRPREEWILYIHGDRRKVLSEYDNLAWATGKGKVFDPNPLGDVDWRDVYDAEAKDVLYPPAEAFKSRTLRELTGSEGYLDGRRVTTRITPARVRKADRDFRFTWRGKGWLETSVYYHLDQVIGYVESLGYTGARVLFKEPLPVDARWGDDDNSNFDPAAKTLQFGLGGVPDAEDAEVVLHEFGHALQDAICPDFGQSHLAAAMGEGFADYLAGSFFAEKKPLEYRDLVMSWSGLPWEEEWNHGPERGKLPFLRRLDGKGTYKDVVHRYGQEHRNGPIWSATLWDVWKALGRDVADRIIIDSHFQLDGYTKFVRGARAIIDADVNLFGGEHKQELRRIFAKRKIGPVQD